MPNKSKPPTVTMTRIGEQAKRYIADLRQELQARDTNPPGMTPRYSDGDVILTALHITLQIMKSQPVATAAEKPKPKT